MIRSLLLAFKIIGKRKWTGPNAFIDFAYRLGLCHRVEVSRYLYKEYWYRWRWNP